MKVIFMGTPDFWRMSPWMRKKKER